MQANIKVNNFAQATPYKFLLDSKISASKVGTRSKSEDHVQFGFLQNHSKLTTTTTNLLQIIYDCNPPKFTQNFENKVLAGISSNTW
jgi:hypothetical protein